MKKVPACYVPAKLGLVEFANAQVEYIYVTPNSTGERWSRARIANYFWIQNQWHTFRVEFNLDKEVFNVYFDGDRIVANNVKRIDCPNVFTTFMVRAFLEDTTGPVLYIDDLLIETLPAKTLLFVR